MAGTGAGSPSEGYPKLLNALAGTKFKIISGYPGSTQGMMAVERGEVDGRFTSWNTLKRTKQDWLQNRDLSTSSTNARSSAIPTCPMSQPMSSWVHREATPDLAFYVSSAAVGRSILAPPGIPADRVNILRRAFDATIKDPEFLAEIEKSRQEFQPASGEELQKLIARSGHRAARDRRAHRSDPAQKVIR